jgi:hypothetical protein
MVEIDTDRRITKPGPHVGFSNVQRLTGDSRRCALFRTSCRETAWDREHDDHIAASLMQRVRCRLADGRVLAAEVVGLDPASYIDPVVSWLTNGGLR